MAVNRDQNEQKIINAQGAGKNYQYNMEKANFHLIIKDRQTKRLPMHFD